MKAWTRPEDWTNLLAGLYLFAGPFLFGTTGQAASSWNAYVAGVLIAVVALWALAQPGSKAAEWTNVVLGTWLILAPFVLGFVATVAALSNALAVGAVVATLSAVALWRLGTKGGTPQKQS